MDGTPTPMHLVRRALDVLRRRLRWRRPDLHDVQRVRHGQLAGHEFVGLSPTTRETVWALAARQFSRPTYRYSLSDDLVIVLVRKLMELSDAGTAIAGEVSRHELNCPGLDGAVMDVVNGATALLDLLQIVIAETPTPHDQGRSVNVYRS